MPFSYYFDAATRRHFSAFAAAYDAVLLFFLPDADIFDMFSAAEIAVLRRLIFQPPRDSRAAMFD